MLEPARNRPLSSRHQMSCGLASTNLRDRVQQLARDWRLLIQESFETETSVVSFVTRDDQSLVLKVIKQENDEWRAGEILNAFGANGVAQVFEHTGGAMLLERLQPGNSLADLSLAGGDEEATEILAGVIRKMSPHATPDGCPKVEDWGKGFERYLATGDVRIPRRLVDAAQRVFAELCASQSRTRLLHGDLHHYNVLFDSQRGWLAIDPKGVIGEVEYEIGAILRNPFERPDLFLSRSTIERRIEQLTAKLNLNRERVVAWAFAQAVLSAIWQIEDGFEIDGSNTSLKLAKAISPMLMVPGDVE
jgi:streptomycin 6-kinase